MLSTCSMPCCLVADSAKLHGIDQLVYDFAFFFRRDTQGPTQSQQGIPGLTLSTEDGPDVNTRVAAAWYWRSGFTFEVTDEVARVLARCRSATLRYLLST